MNLLEVIRENCVETGVEVADKAGAIRAIARLARQSGLLEKVSEKEVVESLEAREELGSTGFGNGIAIPHCRLAGAEDFVVGMMTLPSGIAFDALDGKPVYLVVFIIAPETQTDAHIKLLSAISQTLRIPGAVKEMIAAVSAEALLESFVRYTRDESDEKDYGSRNLFQVFVENEDLFHELLQVITGLSPDSVMVLEGRNTGAYLSRMPLFAGFWGDNADRFMRVIVGAVEKKLTNETIRRIESVTGRLEDRDDVMVVVQNLVYMSGRLGA